MSQITKDRGAALARVCRLVLAAKRHGQTSVSTEELELALAGVDVAGLANPRPTMTSNIASCAEVVAARA